MSYVDYDAWGKPVKKLILKNGQRELDLVTEYTGHPYDQVLGLYFAEARMYDAEDRRFVSVDWVKGSVSRPQSLVQYVYVLDNPVRWVDVNGLITIEHENTVNNNKTHSNKYALSNIQEWLRSLGYLDINDDEIGIDYGGKTAAAVMLFQLNYGMTPSKYVDDFTYLAIANAVALQKYETAGARRCFYNGNVNYLKYADNYKTKYFRSFDCYMEQEVKNSHIGQHKGDITTTAIDGIIYFDYTVEIDRALRDNIDSFLSRRVKYTYSEYVDNNRIWIFIPSYDSYQASYIIPAMFYFAQEVKPKSTWDLKHKPSWVAMFNDRILYYNRMRQIAQPIDKNSRLFGESRKPGEVLTQSIWHNFDFIRILGIAVI